MARALNDLVGTWGETRGLSPRADDDGRHFFVFDGDYEIALSQIGPRLNIEAELCAVPRQRQQAEALLEDLLSLQLAKAGDSVETLAIDPDSDKLVLYREVPIADLTDRAFADVLAEFVNALAVWSKKTESGQADAASAPPAQIQIMYP